MSKFPFASLLSERAQKAGLPLEPTLSAALEVFFEVLRRWNRKINLTGLDLDALTVEGMDRLFVEPLLAARHVPPHTRSIIDLGTGGGSPAIPLTLAVPSASVTMVESRSKKSVFLLEAARELGLAARVLTARYQDVLGKRDLLEAFDVLTSRALRLDSHDVSQVHALVRGGGRLLLFRSTSLADKLTLSPPLSVAELEPLPRTDSQLIVLEKQVGVPRGTLPST